MTNSTVFLFVLIAIVIFFLLSLWLIKTFVSMSKEEKKLRNKCPFDHEHCGIIGKSITDQYITKICKKCPRYKNWKDDIFKNFKN